MEYNLKTPQDEEIFKDYLLSKGFNRTMFKEKKQWFKKGWIMVCFDYINISVFYKGAGIYKNTKITDDIFNDLIKQI